MKKFFFLPLLAAMMLLGACESVQWNKQTGGTLVGAGLGGFLGSQVGSGTGQLVATAMGTLGGAVLGGEVGRSLDRADRLYAVSVPQYSTAPRQVIVHRQQPPPQVVYVRPYQGLQRCYDSSYNRSSRRISGQTIYKVFTGDIRPWERSRVYGSLIPSYSESASTSCHRTYYR